MRVGKHVAQGGYRKHRSMVLLAVVAMLASMLAAIPATAATATPFTNQASFETTTGATQIAWPGSTPAEIDAALTILRPFGSDLGSHSCEWGSPLVTPGGEISVTNPTGDKICYIGPDWTADLTNTNPKPRAATIVDNGEDDYQVTVAPLTPVGAIGFSLLTNSSASETVTLTYDDATTETFTDSALGTSPNGFYFIGFSSPKPIVAVTIDTTGGASQNEGIEGIWLIPFNHPPIADANGPYVGDEGSAISLDGTGSSDPDGDPVTYSWSVDSALCSFDDATSATPNLTCTDNGNFTVTLVVDDGNGLFDTDSAPVTVNNVAPAVSIDDYPMVPVETGTTGVVDFSFTDPGSNDSHTATCEWDGITQDLGPVTSPWSCDAPDTAGIYTVTVTVTDDDGGVGMAMTGLIVVYDPSGGFVTGGGWFNSPAGAYKMPSDEMIWDIGIPDGLKNEFFPSGADSGFVCDHPTTNGNVGNFVVGTTPEGDFPGTGRSTDASLSHSMYAFACNSVTIEFLTTETWYESMFTYARMGGENTEVWFDGVRIGDTTADNPGVDPHASIDYFFIPGAITPGTHYLTIVGMAKPTGFSNDGVWWNDYLRLDGTRMAPDDSVVGKANFGFVAKYKKGANVPDGNTQFQFKAGDLNFHSTSYEWLVVTGGNDAKFKGVGTINGVGEYKFQIWAGDGDPDTFRIKIWTEDVPGVEIVIYDNGGQAIDGGSIVIHKK